MIAANNDHAGVERVDLNAHPAERPKHDALGATCSTRQADRLWRTNRPALNKHSAAKGFTLVELLVGATLSAMVMAAVLSSYVYLAKHFVRLTNQQSQETESRRTLGYFTRDVQVASGIDTSQTLSASRCSLTVPTTTGTNAITYYYNNGASTSVTINGTSVTMAANSLARCVYNGTTVTSQTLLRNITSAGLNFYYYDASGRIYTVYSDYLPGIKQMMLQFSTQAGVSASGTQTLVYQVSSSRLIVRNKAVLP
jgi:prepilin-type N-terminal cleavage/methylation domain-containing protein